jgi:hypothetical protein
MGSVNLTDVTENFILMSAHSSPCLHEAQNKFSHTEQVLIRPFILATVLSTLRAFRNTALPWNA